MLDDQDPEAFEFLNPDLAFCLQFSIRWRNQQLMWAAKLTADVSPNDSATDKSSKLSHKISYAILIHFPHRPWSP